jgi:peptidoglycan/xylan/chitin deacetylase (PgdA/CDA1 family)
MRRQRPLTRMCLMLIVLVAFAAAGPRTQTPAQTKAQTSTMEKSVAVTIDDLPAPGGGLVSNTIAGLRENTEKLLAACRKAGVPVVGFVNEAKLVVKGETDADRAAREAALKLWTDNGFELGNHTLTHTSLNQSTVEAFKKDVIEGEPVTRRLMKERGGTLRYFRHPYLHVGMTLDVRRASEAFLAERGYIIAPVTVDAKDYIYASAYASAVRNNDKDMAAKLAADYLRYSDEIFAFSEETATRLMGRDISHVLLLHANAINADHFGALADVIKKRGYRFITLEEALKDEAYKQPDTYVGSWGHVWLRHWEQTSGKKLSESAEPPDWVRKYTAR